ncbi:MAG: molybdenum cofactor biosynthesis protein, partial [Alphaproteobacteria bacterium]|nr:molybdenum cofactor biosynthesis protein [Alphaproteobacteria bacterium]
MPQSVIDETIRFIPVRIAVLTVSDTRTTQNDTSGDTLASRITEAGHILVARNLLRDDVTRIRAQLSAWIADPEIDCVITTGGTGLTGRDVTVEAMK